MPAIGTNIAGLKRASALELDWDLHFQQAPTRLAYDYWSARRAGRTMPSRDDLSPRDMRKFSPHIGLIEVQASGDGPPEYFIRRAGGRWEEVYGPMTGRHIHEFLPPVLEMRWRDLFGAVIARKAPVCARTGIEFQKKTWLMAEMLVAPLGHGDTVNMLLMCFVSRSTSETR